MEEERSQMPKQSLVPFVIAAGSKVLLENMGAVGTIGAAAAFAASPFLVGSLLAAGAFHLGKLFFEDDASESRDTKIIESLQRTSLNVEIAPSGEVSTTVSNATPTADRPGKQVVIERRQETTIVQIQNLNINLTSDVVQQLNMNPKEVINQLTEQIKETTLNAMAKAEKE